MCVCARVCVCVCVLCVSCVCDVCVLVCVTDVQVYIMCARVCCTCAYNMYMCLRMTVLVHLHHFSVNLNTTYSMHPSEYYLGVCTNPLKDSSSLKDCYAVHKASNGFDYENLCIGIGIEAHFVDQRGQPLLLSDVVAFYHK